MTTLAGTTGPAEVVLLSGTQTASSSFSDFFTEMYAPLAAYAWSMTRDTCAADDLAQEAMTRVYARWGLLLDARSYAYRIVTNLVRDRWQRMRRDEVRLRDLAPRTDSQPAPDDSVLDAVRRLPAGLREVVVLHYYADLPVAEIAHVLRRPAGTVKRRLHEARALLATALQEER